ncbi:MAG: hypothetical protein WCX22_06490 [Methanoregula sp.]
MTHSYKIKLVAIAGLLLLVLAGSGIASAYSISAHANETQLEMIKEMYGTKVTFGDYWGKVFPEQLAELKKNVPEKEYLEFTNTIVYWGDDHPELPYGATVWDENGPVNLSEISSEEKQKFGLENLQTDESGYVVRGSDSEKQAMLDKLCTMITKRTAKAPMSGLVLSANNLDNTGSSIIHSGGGQVAGGNDQTTLFLKTELYGDGMLVDSYDDYWGSGGNIWQTIDDEFYNPQRRVLYQSKLSGQSTNPSHSGYTWSFGEVWPF